MFFFSCVIEIAFQNRRTRETLGFFSKFARSVETSDSFLSRVFHFTFDFRFRGILSVDSSLWVVLKTACGYGGFRIQRLAEKS